VKETTTEMGLIEKAAFHCDFTQRVARPDHQVLGSIESHSQDVPMRRTPKTRFECPMEFPFTQLRNSHEIAQSDPRVQM
jgi:hypothetical protein